jgi:hypothetical protein
VTVSEDGIWSEVQERTDEDKNSVPSTVTRTVKDGKLTAECKANGVISKRIFHQI